MIFNKNGRHIRRVFKFGQEKLETTRQYKYLGFLVTPSGEANSGLRDLRDRAQRAFSKLKKKMGITFRQKPSTLFIEIFARTNFRAISRKSSKCAKICTKISRKRWVRENKSARK